MTTPNFMTWDHPGVAIITGASSGIGAEFAKQLAKQGFNLILVARRRELLERLAFTLHAKHGVTVEVIDADLSKRTEVEMLARKLSAIDKLDILVNNAGFGNMSLFAESDLQSQLDMIEVHNCAPTVLTHSVLSGMLKRNRGVIIFTSSMSAFLPSPDFAMYTATKAFLVGFAQVLKLELQGSDVRVQALVPGFTHTEFHDAPGLREMKSSVPKFLFGSAENVIKASLKGARKRKVIVVPGLINRLVLLLPKRWTT